MSKTLRMAAKRDLVTGKQLFSSLRVVIHFSKPPLTFLTHSPKFIFENTDNLGEAHG